MKRLGLPRQHAGDHTGGTSTGKRRSPGEHFIKHESNREDVGTPVRGEPLELLGRHVLDRTDQRTVDRQRCT